MIDGATRGRPWSATAVRAEFSWISSPTSAQLVVDEQEASETKSSQVPDALPWGCGMLSTFQCAPSKLSAQARAPVDVA